ncbi:MULTISPECIES: fluoride efflux transporter CrcB [Carboxydocella]|uniref:Fluoride-specific ion channel FluC n=2 Tax=Carboxydocella TaxID=178898 RepID=A0A1T4RT22_9FIRM|nr:MULTISPECIES: fluoride efflux transporter CrcB [Carboxydocella]AVX20410.1 CrcB protein [Carboxydocella thermautotrophica]GAW28079.1 camphor resistance protein CrcB [Carboxydocella sp. ULO1]GAW32456.1 camphor resistance protein CrcB [Carboxydocella sp. JDF658]SKA19134.1 CrcB protein [Carboxydocella sporoproducens DSM 16521]
MKDLLAIALGGLLGAVARYSVNQLAQGFSIIGIPTATLIVNLLGSFGLAFFLQKSLTSWGLAAHWRLGIATGFFGAFTTFSTFMLENVALLLKHNYLTAFSYLLMTAFLAAAAGFLGWFIAETTTGQTLREKE